MKVKWFFFFILTFFAIVLLALAVWASTLPLSSLGIVYPKNDDSFSINSSALEENRDELLPLSFLSKSKISVKVQNTAYTVDKLATTHSLLSILNYPLLAGDFMPKNGNGSYIVLNKMAAFQFFGSTNVVGEHLELEGQSLKISGVVDDYHDESIIYTSGAGDVEAQLLLYATGKDFNDLDSLLSYTLQSMGIIQGGYETTSLDTIMATFANSFKLAAILLLGILSLQIFMPKFFLLKDSINALKKQLAEKSLLDCYRSQPEEMKKTFYALAVCLVGGLFFWVSIIYFVFNTVSFYMSFSVMKSFDFSNYLHFSSWIETLKKGFYLQQAVFVLFAGMSFMYVVLLFKRGYDEIRMSR